MIRIPITKTFLTKLSHRIALATVATQVILAIAVTSAMPAMAQSLSAASSPTGSSGGEMSLGAVLAMVGGILVKSTNSTSSQIASTGADAAKKLDATTTSGGPTGSTAAQNQQIQQLTFNQQQSPEAANRSTETVTNLSKSGTDAQKSQIQNLSIDPEEHK